MNKFISHSNLDTLKYGQPISYFFFFDIYFSPSQTELVLSWIYIYFIFYSCNRQVAANGWSEGEYNGKAGWFPSAYVERQEKAPASKLLEESPKP